MPTFRHPDFEQHYQVDNFTPPWSHPETILLLHGNCESGAVWFGWVPHLARHYRVVRPDMRGFGDSTPMPRDFSWTLDIVIDDYVRLMDHLGIDKFHLVGAKIGGVINRGAPGYGEDEVLIAEGGPTFTGSRLTPNSWSSTVGTFTVPLVGFVMPATSLSAVLLPDPLRPITP